MRPALGDARHKACKASACLRRHRVTLDRNSCRFQPVEALACGTGVGVGQRTNHPRRFGGNQAVSAGGSARAVMRARLETNIDDRPCRCVSGLCERDGLRMRSAVGLGPAAPDDDAVFDDDAADRRVITSPPLAAFGKRNRGRKPAPVFGRDGYFDAPTRAAMSASALARRSASSFCASASSFSTSIPTALPKAL